MSPIRAVARPLLASVFVTGGIDALRHPGPKAEIVRGAGLSSPETLVRVNGGVDLLAGVLLARGRAPRLSALLLAGSIAPTTYIGHPFWSEKDKAVRKQQQLHFFKNLGLLGGLLMTVADTGGRESLPHAAGRVSRKASKASKASAKSARKAAKKKASDLT